MSRKIAYALLSIAVLALAGAGVMAIRARGISSSNEQAIRNNEQGLAEGREAPMVTIPTTTQVSAASLETTVPETTQPRATTTTAEATTTTVPPTRTTIPPSTTTTIPLPVTPDRNQPGFPAAAEKLAELHSDVLGSSIPVFRMTEDDHGAASLRLGAIWFPSGGNIDGQPANDLSLFGAGGNVAVGAHRGGDAMTGLFGKLHLLQIDDEVTFTTGWGASYTYRVTMPCPDDGDQSDCSLDTGPLMLLFRDYQNPSGKETLFLASCDDGKRMYVILELVRVNDILV